MSDLAVIEALDMASLPDKRKQRQAICELEALMLQQEQVPIEPQHLVHGGIYARAVTVPAGTLLTGHIYKFDHIELMASGTLVVTTDDGSSRILKGFNLMPALSGKKRAAYAIEDTTWVTFHTNDDQTLDPEVIQKQLTCETFDDLDSFYNDVNRADYQFLLQQLGWTQEKMDEIVMNEDDLYDINLDGIGVSLFKSRIHGHGIRAQKSFSPGEHIGYARILNRRTQLGRYINHAVRPNCYFDINGESAICVAADNIAKGDELTVNYRLTLAERATVGDI